MGFLVAGLFLSIPRSAVPPLAGARWATAATPSGEMLVLEVAATPAARSRGLGGRSEVPPGTGMLFVFPRPGPEPFWMKGCLVPLDIAWLDGDGRVVHLEENLPPCREDPCPTWTPGRPASFVIEVGAGEARRLGLVPGAVVLLAPLEEGP